MIRARPGLVNLVFCALDQQLAAEAAPTIPMKKTLITLMFGLCASLAIAADTVPAHPYVEIVTTEGTIILELDGKQAPITVGHFLELVDSGFYDGTIFHRVMPGFMAQAGGITPNLKRKETDATIPNESGNGMSNVRGTVAMALSPDRPHSANSQFFINLVDNLHLDPQKMAPNGRWGYTVFGFVIQGMDVVDKIGSVETGPQGPFVANVPLVPIVIKKMSRYTFE
jgi:cyclophilin family peptidyl-prolyl cis-trans isomerase